MTKIDLGEVASKTEKKSDKPTMPPNENLTALVEQFQGINPQFKNLKSQNETLSKQIAAVAKRITFRMLSGSAFVSTVLYETGKGIAKLTFKNQYSKKLTDWRLLEAAIGPKKAEQNFRFSTELAFAIDALPEDQQEACANALIGLAKEKGWMAAISATQYIAPRVGFHEARTTLLTPDENEKLDQVLPITAFPML